MISRVWNQIVDRSLLLVAGAGAGLLWANTDLASYERIAHALHFAVNDVGMAFFFALATKEVVEATAPGGALHSRRTSAMPILAAIGGMAGPALIFVALAVATSHHELLRGWAVPCATDIAFSYLVARFIFGAKHPVIPFLLLLAIADDALGLMILAVFYPSGSVELLEFVGWLSIAMGVAALTRARAPRSFWPQIIGAGSLSWIAFYRGGLHPALALVPIVPFIAHARRAPGLLVESHEHDPLTRFEHWWKGPVQVVLFFFGLVNAGVPVTSTGPGTWIVLGSILAGKPIGILLFVVLGVAGGLHLPKGVSRSELAVAGMTAAIGFTVALFFATAAFPPGVLLDEIKMGALLSFSAAPIAAAFAAAVGIRRARS